MKMNFFKLFATAAVIAGTIGGTSIAFAEKSGGILKFYHRGTPPSGSIHEEATSSTVVPYMSVFNNLVMFDQACGGGFKFKMLSDDFRSNLPSQIISSHFLVFLPVEAQAAYFQS